MPFLIGAIGLVAGYLLFVILRLGLHERLFLALGPINLQTIPDRAARRYGERELFTTDKACAWDVPALRGRYANPCSWSASRIRVTADHIATLLRGSFGVAVGERVAVLKENHFDIQILLLGIVRAGGIACSINGRFPSSKFGAYVHNVGARVLITDTRTLHRLLRERAGLGSISTIVIAETRRDEPDGWQAQVETLLGADHPTIELFWLTDALSEFEQESAPASQGKDDPMYLVHSSGTTGFPKAVILKNGAQSHAVRGWLCYVHVSRRVDKGYFAVPNSHQAVILSFYSLLLLGLPVRWTSAYDREGLDPHRIVRELSEGRYTGFFAFPVVYTQLMEVELGGYDLGSMRFWASTADAAHEVVQRRFAAVGSAFRRLGFPGAGSIYLDAQGSSEVGTPSVIRYVTPFTRRFERRIGRPGSSPFGPRVRVVNEDGTPVPTGEVGRLEVRGKTVFAGYWNHHTLTFKAFRDGWFFTGDVVRRGRDGHLVQLDREVDVIHTSNGPVYSLPIEETVHKHPAVFDVCVYGERQPDGAQRPAAIIALRTNVEISDEQLREAVNRHLSDDEKLQRLTIIPWADFPMGITGKTLKRVLRERREGVPPEEQNQPVSIETERISPSRMSAG